MGRYEVPKSPGGGQMAVITEGDQKKERIVTPCHPQTKESSLQGLWKASGADDGNNLYPLLL